MGSKYSIAELLELGRGFLKLNLGIVARIHDQTYTVYFCTRNSMGIKPGDTFDLSETYCSDVINSGSTRYYDDVATISEMLKHPCYLNTQLRAYIGTPIRIDNRVWGTLNYSSLSPRDHLYNSEEVAFLEQQAQTIAELLQAQL